MEKTKIVSVRLDVEDIDFLDKEAKKSWYYKRSDFIQAAVRLMIVACKKGFKNDVLGFYPKYDDVAEFEFKRKRKER